MGDQYSTLQKLREVKASAMSTGKMALACLVQTVR
jgi:hypothetical protein